MNVNAIPVVKTFEHFDKLFANPKSLPAAAPGRKRWVIVRHGESTANLIGINAGQTVDADLTSKGREQVRQTAKTIDEMGVKFDTVYITPLKRTAQSLDEMRKIIPTLPAAVVEKAFLEKHCGRLEGMTKHLYEPYKIKEEDDIKALSTFEEKFSYKMVEDQESLKDVFIRSQNFILDHSKQAVGSNILVVSHVGLMRSLILGSLASRKIEPVDLEVRSFEIPNGAILVLESDAETIELVAASNLKFLR